MHKFPVRSLLVGLLAAAFCANPVWAEPTLAERRAITAYEQGTYATLLKDIQSAAGFAVPVEVQWNTIAIPDESKAYGDEDYWTNIIFVPLKNALAAVAADDMGKKAVKEKLKKIVVLYDKATGAQSGDYTKGVSFKEGVLTVNFRPYVNSSDVKPRAEAIQQVLEKAL